MKRVPRSENLQVDVLCNKKNGCHFDEGGREVKTGAEPPIFLCRHVSAMNPNRSVQRNRQHGDIPDEYLNMIFAEQT
jgi:hypothetical protein